MYLLLIHLRLLGKGKKGVGRGPVSEAALCSRTDSVWRNSEESENLTVLLKECRV